jgi:hypothetical protein
MTVGSTPRLPASDTNAGRDFSIEGAATRDGFMKALAISVVATLCSGMAVPASAMPNMPHLFAEREVARCGGDVAHASKHYQYRNSSRGYSDDAGACHGCRPSSPW